MLRPINTGQIFSSEDIKKLRGEFDIIFSHHDMTKLKPGDRVDCRISSSTIVGPYSNYDEIKTFEIVANDELGYYLYVPHYFSIKGTMVADRYRCQTLGINKKFINEDIIYIQENLILHVHARLDGMNCKVCKEFSSYAEPNQPNGLFICFSCRANPYNR